MEVVGFYYRPLPPSSSQLGQVAQEVARAAWNVSLKYLQAAEEEEDPADPARVFYCTLHLAELVTAGHAPEGFTVGELEALLSKCKVAGKACRPWMPPNQYNPVANRTVPAEGLVEKAQEAALWL